MNFRLNGSESIMHYLYFIVDMRVQRFGCNLVLRLEMLKAFIKKYPVL